MNKLGGVVYEFSIFELKRLHISQNKKQIKNNNFVMKGVRDLNTVIMDKKDDLDKKLKERITEVIGNSVYIKFQQKLPRKVTENPKSCF